MQSQAFFDDFVYKYPSYESVEALLQKLVQGHRTMGVNGPSSDPCGDETIVDVVMDGYRYTLVRTWADDMPTAKFRLSPREQEIVQLVAKGWPNKTIAASLKISPCTVATHIRRIFDKVNAKSRAEMVARVMGYAN